MRIRCEEKNTANASFCATEKLAMEGRTQT